ncbi:S8 family peptidase [Kitasatospora sp. NPDC088391]|uniref:S8 family peptidase n=1 Tax=Kitasatospora sp. NPDC088391 TaxID=3364074 RepID=UPI00381BED2C
MSPHPKPRDRRSGRAYAAAPTAATAVALAAATALAAALTAVPARAVPAPVPAAPIPAAPASAPGGVRPAAEPIAGRYLVVLKDTAAPAAAAATATAEQRHSAVAAAADRLAGAHGGTVRTVFDTALHGYLAELTPAQAERVAADPAVDHVEQDGVQHQSLSPDTAPGSAAVTVPGSARTAAPAAGSAGTQSAPPSWGLDRIDQRDLPLDKAYHYPGTASNVTVYLVDSGLRTTHSQFQGRASIGVDLVKDGRNGGDCLGHGTHVAGTVGGKDYGVAKAVKLVAVRVTPCNNSIPTSAIVSAADWITKNAVKPAVVNMSINGGVSSTEDKAIKNSIAAGITWVVSSGNGNADACRNSPGDIAEAIVVNNATSDDARRSDSDYGSCTDLFAPGTGITSAWNSGDQDTHVLTGTSMAAPHVTGAAALYLSAHPQATPADVQSALTGAATQNRISGAGQGTPNRLLYVG